LPKIVVAFCSRAPVECFLSDGAGAGSARGGRACAPAGSLTSEEAEDVGSPVVRNEPTEREIGGTKPRWMKLRNEATVANEPTVGMALRNEPTAVAGRQVAPNEATRDEPSL
jgi:hypothetical protein